MDREKIKYSLKKPVKYGIWALGVFIFLTIAMAAIENQSHTLIKAVRVQVEPLETGEVMIDENDVFTALEINFGSKLKAVMIDKIETSEVERVLEEVPFIENADVYFDAKNQLHIKVDQRKPIVRVIDNNGFNYYLDGHGRQIPLSEHGAPRVVVLTGEVVPYEAEFMKHEEHQLSKIFKLIEHIRMDEFWNPMIEQIDVNRKGEVRLIPKLGDQEIILGTPDDLETKFKKLRKVYAEVIPRKGWRLYKTIDVSYKNQAICKK